MKTDNFGSQSYKSELYLEYSTKEKKIKCANWIHSTDWSSPNHFILMDNNQCHCNLHCIIIIDWLWTLDPHAAHSFLFKLKARLTRYDCKSLTKSNKTKILPTLHGDIPLRFLSPYPPPSTLTIWWFLNTDHRLVSLSLVLLVFADGRYRKEQATFARTSTLIHPRIIA